MSNEELAERIRDGDDTLTLDLWNGVKGFVYQQAFRYCSTCPGRGGNELEDLVQSSFIAMMEAVKTFRRDKDCGFLTWLDYYLRNEWQKCLGIRTTRRDALNENVLSLDAPIDENQGDGVLADTVPDPTDRIADVERKIYLEQLRAALDTALDQLPAEQREILKQRYYNGIPQAKLAESTRRTRGDVLGLERRGLDQLRREKRRNGLEQFVDECTPFYRGVGINEFTATHTSAVEKAVLCRERIREEHHEN